MVPRPRPPRLAHEGAAVTVHHPNYAGAGFPWELRPEADKALREEWATGAPTSTIATRLTKRLGATITKSSVIGRVHRLGLPSRPSPIRRDAAKLGAGAVTIAAQRATSEYTLRRRAKKAEGIRPAKVAMLPPVEVAPEPAPAPRPLAAPRDGCRFPLWGDGRPTHRYCDQPRITNREGTPTSAYCAEHHRRCTVRAITLSAEQRAAIAQRMFLARAARTQQDGRTKLVTSSRLGGDLA
jgi:GcrA cell cycle regulator